MIELNEAELIARAAKRRNSRGKRAILQHNLETLLRLRAHGVSYREIADAFAEQGVSITPSTICRFLKHHVHTDADSLSNGRKPKPNTSPNTSPPIHPPSAENVGDTEALEAEEEDVFWRKVRQLKQEVAERHAGEIPDTSSLRRHLEI